MRKEAMSGLGIARATDFVRESFSGFQFGQGTEVKGRFNMKKLMFAAAAIAAGIAVADVTSANIVGYNGISTEVEGVKTTSMGVGSVFLPVAGVGEGNTYKLKDIVVICETKGKYLNPGSEYFQKLDPTTTEVEKRYTYVSREAIEDNVDEWNDAYLQGVGWWENRKGIISSIEDLDFSDMCGDDDIPVGTAFLALVSDKKQYRIQSSGAVPLESSGISTEKTSSLFFLNYLPTSIDINSLTIDVLKDSGEVDASKYLNPGSEYFQVLDPSTTEVRKRYTYVSRMAIEDNVDEWNDAYLQGVGWWENRKGIISSIEDLDFSDMLKGGKAVTLTPGFSFLSLVSDRKNYRINFPAAVGK